MSIEIGAAIALLCIAFGGLIWSVGHLCVVVWRALRGGSCP